MKSIRFLLLALLVFAPLALSAYANNPAAETDNRYIRRYVAQLQTLQVPTAPKIIKSGQTGKEWTMGLTVNPNLGILVSADAKGITGFIFSGTGDGTPQSGVNVAIGAVSAVTSLYPHRVTKTERSRILKKIMNQRVLSGKNERFNYHGYTITASFTKQTGLMITADRLKK